jgi:poly-gamma-glutamate capsule biosynthesis protein CapA/YwtB (metallophosphatase superfamily)
MGFGKMLIWHDVTGRTACRVALCGDFLPAGELRVPAGSSWQSMAKRLLCYWEDVDLSFMNLECPIGVGSAKARPKAGLGDSFSAGPEALAYLQVLRTAAVSTANNHIYDYGDTGVRSTLEAVCRAGIAPIGSARYLKDPPEVFVSEAKPGLRIGFWAAACASRELAGRNLLGVEPATLRRAREALGLMRARGACCSIALLHAGCEHTNLPAPEDVKLMDAMAGLGFSVVAACHSHRISGYKFLRTAEAKNAVCFYGLGSIASGVHYSSLEREGIAAMVEIDQLGKLVRIEANPIYMAESGWGSVPDGETSRCILERFQEVSRQIEDGTYQRLFYRDIGRDLLARQYRDFRIAFHRGGLKGVNHKLARLRARHVTRLFHKVMGA